MLKNGYKTIDEYIATFPQSTQKLLQQIRSVIAETAPDAKEAISYMMPTFKLNGNLIHFAGYKSHIGLYPGPVAIEAFKEELRQYETSKGAIQFPLDKPLPLDLVKKIVEYRVKQSVKKASSQL